MSLFTDYDLQAIIEPFGISIIANIGTSDEIRFTAIFDRPQSVEYGSLKGPAIITQDAQLICLSKDVEDLQQDKPILVNNVNYKIRDVLPDGTGLTTINLLRMQKGYK